MHASTDGYDVTIKVARLLVGAGLRINSLRYFRSCAITGNLWSSFNVFHGIIEQPPGANYGAVTTVAPPRFKS